jgi:hypothetical protein
MHYRQSYSALLLGLVSVLPACDRSSASGAASGAASAPQMSASPAATPSSRPAATATAEPSSTIPTDWKEVDLSPAGKAWADYSIMAPPGAQVTKGFPDTKVKAGDFSIGLSFTNNKKKTSDLDTARGYGVSWRALTDTDELFEYETSGVQDKEKFVRFSFDMFPNVGGKRLGCYATDNKKQREELADMMLSCRTLRKK